MHKIDNKVGEDTKKQLVEAAIGALPNSHAPYSKYNVAAAALFDSGKIYTGVNVESASYGATICAERNAIFHAVAEGERKLLAIAVVGGVDGNFGDDYCMPCGICRQVMRDFGDKDTMLLITAKSPSDYKEYTLDEILPYSFGPESLG